MKVLFDVCCVGAGVGGLISSTILAMNGYQVALVEKNQNLGGRMNSEVLVNKSTGNSYRFDVGPSLLLLPDVYRQTFELLGERLEDHIDIMEVYPFYRCYFEEDSTMIDIQPDMLEMEKKIEEIEKGGFEKLQSYMDIAHEFLRFGLPNVIEEKMDLQYALPFLIACVKAFPLQSHYNFLKTTFSSKKLRALMSFQDLYIGLSPYKASAVFSLLQALEFKNGIYYPRGGFGSVTRALETVAKKTGVQIYKNCDVQEFIFQEQSKLQNSKWNFQGSSRLEGITYLEKLAGSVEKKVISAANFIVNVDSPQAEHMFFKSNLEFQDKRTVGGTPSCSVVSLNFVLNRRFDELAHHTIFLSSKYKDSWRVVDEPGSSFNPEEFNFYVHAPSRTDPSVCPDSDDAITVLVPVPPIPKEILNQNQGCAPPTDVTAIRKAVLKRIQAVLPNSIALENHIVAEIFRSPTDWEKDFNLFRGSAFGLDHSLMQLSYLRPRIKHPKINNLFRVGASTRPGNGVPLVMIGAKLTSEVVLKKLDIEKKHQQI